MTAPFLRLSVIERAAAHLRERLEAGEWKSRLPGERWLSERLGISRPTLRAALAILEKEKYFSSAPGRARKILRGGRAKKSRQLVFLYGSEPRFRAIGFIRRLQAALYSHGIDTEEINRGSHTDSESLRLLVERHPHRCWALMGMAQTVQQWFQKQGLPAIVLGSVYPDVRLPSVDIDYRATGRHAAGTFLQLGHRRLGLMVLPQPRAGDIECQDGFVETVRRSSTAGAAAQLIHIGRDAGDLCQKLQQLFRSAEAPTALLVPYPAPALTTLTYCLANGRKIPRDLSLLCRDDDPHFDTLYPAVAHYVHSEAAFVRKALALLLAIVGGVEPPAQKHLLVPQLVRGASLGPPPK